MDKRVKIPYNLYINSLLDGIEGRKDYLTHLRDGFIYFVSLLCVDNYYSHKSKDGYRTLKGEYLDNVIGRGKKNPRRSVEIKRILREKGVIEIRGHQSGVKSQGFRLTEKYSTGEFNWVKLGDGILKRIKLCSKDDDYVEIDNINEYELLKEQFSNHQLSVDLKKFNLYLKKIGVKVFDKINEVKKYKDYNIKSFFNYFGYSLSIINNINNREYFFSVPESNRRFYSNLTSFHKLFRPFLLIDGKQVGEVDIMTSQSYILATILNDRFYNTTSQGYNITTIHPHLKTSIDNIGINNPSNQRGRNEFITGIYFSSLMKVENPVKLTPEYQRKVTPLRQRNVTPLRQSKLTP